MCWAWMDGRGGVAWARRERVRLERRIEGADPKPPWGGALLLASILLSGGIFAGAIFLIICAFALMEAVLT